jgi:hypothetical protein
VEEEEQAFSSMLVKGIKFFETVVAKPETVASRQISGADSFFM